VSAFAQALLVFLALVIACWQKPNVLDCGRVSPCRQRESAHKHPIIPLSYNINPFKRFRAWIKFDLDLASKS